MIKITFVFIFILLLIQSLFLQRKKLNIYASTSIFTASTSILLLLVAYYSSYSNIILYLCMILFIYILIFLYITKRKSNKFNAQYFLVIIEKQLFKNTILAFQLLATLILVIEFLPPMFWPLQILCFIIINLIFIFIRKYNPIKYNQLPILLIYLLFIFIFITGFKDFTPHSGNVDTYITTSFIVDKRINISEDITNFTYYKNTLLLLSDDQILIYDDGHASVLATTSVITQSYFYQTNDYLYILIDDGLYAYDCHTVTKIKSRTSLDYNYYVMYRLNDQLIYETNMQTYQIEDATATLDQSISLFYQNDMTVILMVDNNIFYFDEISNNYVDINGQEVSHTTLDTWYYGESNIPVSRGYSNLFFNSIETPVYGVKFVFRLFADKENIIISTHNTISDSYASTYICFLKPISNVFISNAYREVSLIYIIPILFIICFPYKKENSVTDEMIRC